MSRARPPRAAGARPTLPRARRVGPLLAALLLAPACAPAEEEAAADTAVFVDEDLDGWPLPQDCDDSLPGVHPGATERCNGSDDDCDGVIDDHPTDGIVSWLDMDGDGWGDTESRDLVCTDFESDPRPWVTLEGDCDDGDPRVHPFGFETCANPADEDCDGGANDLDAQGCVAWYVDLDGDGVGTESSACLCEAEGSWRAETPGDCDDGDATVSAGCALTGAMSLADADSVIVGAPERDGAGADIALAGDPDGDGWPDLLVAAGDTRRTAGWWLLRGPFGPSADLAAPSAVYIDPTATTALATRVAGGQDLDGDGLDDVALGVYGAASGTGGRSRGLVYIVSGAATGEVPLEWADAQVETPLGSSAFGLGVAASPDTDGDGVGDLLVGGTDGMSTWLFSGPLEGALTTASASLTLQEVGTSLGAALDAPGDLDGDGLGDLLLGAPSTRGQRGAAWIVAGGSTGTLASGDVAAELEAPFGAELTGRDVAGAGDVDGDGYGDVLVTAETIAGGLSRAGVVWLARGPFAGVISLEDAAARIDGVAASDAAVVASGAGDIDADGFADVAIGATGVDHAATEAGAAYAFLGPISGALTAGEGDIRLYGQVRFDAAGAAVIGGDLDADGFSDLLVGAPGDDLGAGDAGAVYIVRGGDR